MADRSSQLLLTALTRAAADGAGMPLYASKNSPGLFPTSVLGKQTAQRYCDEGYFTTQPANATNGKAVPPVCTISEKGMAYLLGQVSPREVLEDFVRILEEREGQVSQLLGTAQKMQQGIESLRATLTHVLARITAPTNDLKSLFAEFRQEKPTPNVDPTPAILVCLEQWAKSGAQDDFPLPDLYRQLAKKYPSLTIGAFHDSLRQLVVSGQVWLHPWTGPLYEVPDPPFALLVGHEIAYYASLRKGE